MRNIGNNWASGTGIFETIRVEDNQVFALHRHHCRAIDSARKMGFEIPNEDYVAEESYKVINEANYKLGRLRWHFGLDGEFSISYVPFEDPKSPAKLTIIDQRSSDYQVRSKIYPYKNLELLAQVNSAGFDDGIILTVDGQVTESTVATLLLKIDGSWFTPPLSSGILNGVVRALAIEARLAQVRRIDEKLLERVESGLLLTSLRNAQSIGAIDNRTLVINHEKCAEIHKLMSEFKGR